MGKDWRLAAFVLLLCMPTIVTPAARVPRTASNFHRADVEFSTLTPTNGLPGLVNMGVNSHTWPRSQLIHAVFVLLFTYLDTGV